MARLFTFGFDTKSANSEWPTGNYNTNMATTTSQFRTGTDGFAQTLATVASFIAHTGTLARTFYCRVYVLKTANPAATAAFMTVYHSSASTVCSVALTTSGTVILRNSVGTQIGSASSALSNDTWYRVELSWQLNSGASDDIVELLLDGVQVAQSSTQSLSTVAHSQIRVGHADCFVDDVAINDDQGASQNTWPGAAKVVLLKPISDSQQGTWQGAAGGTTNLYDAVDNTPPAGVATASESNTSQIESQDSAGDNTTDEYRANLTTYTTAGITASDTINVVQPFINHGEQVSTGTKTGKFGLQSNPANTNGGGETSFTFGSDSGAVGTFPAQWRTSVGTPLYNPSVTLGSSPVLALRKTDGGTRWAQVDFMGAYVDYTPASAAFAPPPTHHYRKIAHLLVR